ncbi:MAG: YIP1 family protein [Nanoarchaeota archaeon]|nr:YIP1 family protein [Nanoarchaeota archaeon]
MNLKNDLNLAFKPKNFSALVQTTDFNSGLKLMLVWGLFLLIVNVVISLINGAVVGNALGKVFGFSLFVSVGTVIVMIISLLVIALVGGWVSKLFKGSGDTQKSIAALSYAMVPIFIIGVIQNLILFIDTLANISPITSWWITIILMLISLIWVAWLATEGLAWANQIIKWQGLICFVVGFVVISLINLFVTGWLAALLAGLFRGIGVF